MAGSSRLQFVDEQIEGGLREGGQPLHLIGGFTDYARSHHRGAIAVVDATELQEDVVPAFQWLPLEVQMNQPRTMAGRYDRLDREILASCSVHRLRSGRGQVVIGSGRGRSSLSCLNTSSRHR